MKDHSASRVMTRKPKTIHLDEPVPVAYETMRDKHIRHLPVVDDSGRIIGIISDRDVARAMQPLANEPSAISQEVEFKPEHKVRDFMSWPVLSVRETEDLSVATQTILKEKISALIVHDDDDYPRGIVTTDDILRLFLAQMSATNPGKRLTVKEIAYDRLECL